VHYVHLKAGKICLSEEWLTYAVKGNKRIKLKLNKKDY